VRRCHGDLHLRNVCLFEGRPTPFDAIEFSPRIGTIDVLYDLAFLLMDLDHRGLRDSANLVLNNWLWRIDDVAAAPHLEALALLPLFLARRAAIRAHVDAAAAELHAGADGYEARCAAARAYQHRAASYLESRPPRLIAVGGLSGSGKTTLAMALAAKIGRAPGAVVLRSDVERKRLAGIPLEDRLAAGSYTPEASRRIYDRLLHAAEQALAGGQSVIIDAVSARPEERHEIADRAQRLAVPLTGLWLDVPLDIAVARVGARSGDASDAGPEVVRRQQAYELGTIDWHRIEAGGSIERTVAQARALISN
jgi:predicted kinase